MSATADPAEPRLAPITIQSPEALQAVLEDGEWGFVNFGPIHFDLCPVCEAAVCPSANPDAKEHHIAYEVNQLRMRNLMAQSLGTINRALVLHGILGAP